MRAPLLVLLVLLPALAQAAAPEGPRRDLVVLLKPGTSMDLPEGAVGLRLLDGFVVRDASPALERALRGHDRVEAVVADEPLARTASPDPNLRLTRAEPAPGGVAGPLTGRGVTVAVVDSGIDAAHPDLLGRVKANVRLVDGRFLDAPGDANGHGTHVAGIVAASGASSEGQWRGVAPEAALVGIDISERFTTTSAILAYDWLYVHRADHDIRVVVNAWGRVGERRYDPDDPVVRAVDRLVDAGVVVLFSASNHGPGPSTLSVESQNPRVVTVGAVDAAARLMAYSSRGPVAGAKGDAWVKPDLVAPGEDVVGLR
ncbi:MAG TPA: S8 family serine peptidase, partial [Candidatus Thermoplasmatota archaeon]|nr:S8 family serine peptidase [Candidatus Thermoplasmatota archaeon]